MEGAPRCVVSRWRNRQPGRDRRARRRPGDGDLFGGGVLVGRAGLRPCGRDDGHLRSPRRVTGVRRHRRRRGARARPAAVRPPPGSARVRRRSHPTPCTPATGWTEHAPMVLSGPHAGCSSTECSTTGGRARHAARGRGRGRRSAGTEGPRDEHQQRQADESAANGHPRRQAEQRGGATAQRHGDGQVEQCEADEALEPPQGDRAAVELLVGGCRGHAEGYPVGEGRAAIRRRMSFDAAALRRTLGRPVRVVDVCDSTNRVAREAASRWPGPPSPGPLIVAEQQTAGRGRQGRTWDGHLARAAVEHGPGAAVPPDRAARCVMVWAAVMGTANSRQVAQ